MQQDQQNSSSWTPRQTPRLDKATKAHVNKLLRNAMDRQWCKKHGKILPPPKLPPVVLRVIKEWFLLVDDDGSGTLEHHELLAALQAARIPCDAESITEMIKLMDANCDGCISWDEFEKFMMNEFAAGQQLLSGEFVLPSGTALPFGAMVRQLKRNQMMKDVTEGGEARTKWMHFDVNITADAAELARAEEAIRIQKEYNETLHLHVQHQHQQQMLVAATLQQWQHKSGAPQPAPAATAPAAAAKLSAAEAIQAAAAASGFDSNGVLPGSTLAAKSRPGGVPRLNLGSINGSGSTQEQRQHSAKATNTASSRAAVGFLTAGQTADLMSRLPANLDVLIGSPRFAGSTASTARTSRHLLSSARLGSQQPTARSARGAAEKYAGLCKSARAAAAAAAIVGSSDGSSSSSGSVSEAGAAVRAGGSSSGKLAQPAATTSAVQAAAGMSVLAGRQPQGERVHSAASSARRPYSASTGQGKVQPQPSRDEWRAVAASCLTQRHATKVRSPRGPVKASQCAIAAAGPTSAAGAVGAACEPAVVSTSAVQVAAAAAAGPAAVAPPTADAASARTSSGGRTRLWENPSASTASTSARTQRVGASGLLSAGAAALAAAAAAAAGEGSGVTGHGSSGRSKPSLAACYGVHNSNSSSSSRKPQAAPSIQRSTAAAAAAAVTVAAAAAADAEPAPPSNDDKVLFTPRTGRGPPSPSTGLSPRPAAGAVGAVNSPRAARQAAAAAAAVGAVTHRPLSSPRHKQDRGSSMKQATQKQPAAASPRVGQQQQQQRNVGLQYRQSSGNSCLDSRGQSDTSRSNKGKMARHGDSAAAATAAAAAAVAERQPGNVLDASCKYLLSACAVPPAALLSPKYMGPVEAAVIRAHTPRHRA